MWLKLCSGIWEICNSSSLEPGAGGTQTGNEKRAKDLSLQWWQLKALAHPEGTCISIDPKPKRSVSNKVPVIFHWSVRGSGDTVEGVSFQHKSVNNPGLNPSLNQLEGNLSTLLSSSTKAWRQTILEKHAHQGSLLFIFFLIAKFHPSFPSWFYN